MTVSDDEIFSMVVEAGSLKGAASQLKTTPSTVSRRLARLEAKLGVKLLERSTRQSHPTEAGTRYYEGLRHLLAEHRALQAQVSGTSDTPSGRLRVAAPQGFGSRFVLPVLKEMAQNYKDLEVELRLGSRFENIVGERLDVAVRIGHLQDSSLRAKPLGVVPGVLVGAPHYLEAQGRPNTPAALTKHNFILYRGPSPTADISVIDPSGARIVTRVRGRFTVNHMESTLDLLRAGVGLHWGPLWAFDEAIRKGELEVLLPTFTMDAYPLHALWAPTPYLPAKIRRFVDALAEALKGEPTLQPPGYRV